MPDGCRNVVAPLSAVVFSIMTFSMLVVGLIFGDQLWIAILLALFFGGIAALSGLITFRDFQARRSGGSMSGLGQEESRILRLAASQKGRLTAEEAAMECHIGVAQAERLLEELVLQGRADTWVSDSGSLVYVFPGLLEDEKSSAEDPMKMLGP